jgi:hypothetical protein
MNEPVHQIKLNWVKLSVPPRRVKCHYALKRGVLSAAIANAVKRPKKKAAC